MVVLLNANYVFLKQISEHTAIKYMVLGKVKVVKKTQRVYRSVSAQVVVPAVVKLVRYVNDIFKRKAPKVPKSCYILRRDQYICQYCGKELSNETATIDHIVPKSRGGETSFENCVAACTYCNHIVKGNRPLEETGLTLRTKPTTPKFVIYESLMRMHQKLGIDAMLEEV